MASIFCSSYLQMASSSLPSPASMLSSPFVERSCCSCLCGWQRKGRRRWPRLRRQRAGAGTTAQLQLLPPPYPLDGLEPHMSRETLEYHWGKHHQDHVDSLNRLITGTAMEDMGLEDIILTSYNKGNPLPVFIHAAQIWNHDFFWQSMKPSGGGHPSGKLMELIDRDFGSFDILLQQLTRAAASQIGSGWAWLAYKANRLDVGNAVNPRPSENDSKLVIHKTPNAVNPLLWDYSPLLVIDIWEHAYILDYENQRTDYVRAFLEKLVSWEVVSSRLENAMARAAERAREDERRRQDDAESTTSDAVEMYLDSENDESEAEAEAE